MDCPFSCRPLTVPHIIQHWQNYDDCVLFHWPVIFEKMQTLFREKTHRCVTVNFIRTGRIMGKVWLSVCLCIIGSAASESRCLIYLWPQLVHPHSSGWEGGLWTLVCGIDLRWQPFMLPAHNPARIITCHTNRQSVLTKHWKDRKVSKHPSQPAFNRPFTCVPFSGRESPPLPS